ncbi:MAG: ion transporter [Myxococcota bacterium]
MAPVGKGDIRDTLYVVIFEHDTRAGKAFDIALLIAILGSMLAVMLESVASIRENYGGALLVTEWIFTGMFTLEYALRLFSVSRPFRYATSFFGVIDLLSVLPTFLAFLVPGSQALTIVRALRLLRVFRVLKLARFVREADTLLNALKASRVKILVFLGFILTFISILASIMYLVEGEEGGFTSIPRAMYWAVVTMTTVGYGDIAPKTVIGQAIAALVMILGYGIIAVPTGIVSVSLNEVTKAAFRRRAPGCSEQCTDVHDVDAKFCKHCGATLLPPE